MRARRKLDAALEALEEARAQLAAQPARSVMLGPIAARIVHRATNAAEAALELAHASEVARGPSDIRTSWPACEMFVDAAAPPDVDVPG